jgi:hypothetical protein
MGMEGNQSNERAMDIQNLLTCCNFLLLVPKSESPREYRPGTSGIPRAFGAGTSAGTSSKLKDFKDLQPTGTHDVFGYKRRVPVIKKRRVPAFGYK